MLPLARPLTLALLVPLAACTSPHEYTVTVRDPHLVTIENAPTPMTVADGAPTLSLGLHAEKEWALVAFREDNGALRLRCVACNRDAFLVGSDGVMHVLDEREPDAIGLTRPSDAAQRDALVVLPYSYCGFPSRHGCAGGVWSGRRLTPWSNVTEIRRRRGPSDLGSPFVLAGGILLAALGGSFLVAGLRSDQPGEEVGGVAGGVLGLTLGAYFVKAFIDGSFESVLDRGGALSR